MLFRAAAFGQGRAPQDRALAKPPPQPKAESLLTIHNPLATMDSIQKSADGKKYVP